MKDLKDVALVMIVHHKVQTEIEKPPQISLRGSNTYADPINP